MSARPIVRGDACDMWGRVFNGHYLTWVDMASAEAIDGIARAGMPN